MTQASDAGAPTTLDPAAFRHVISHFTSGVAIITARHEGRDHGMTASAVSSLSLDPPMLVLCLNRAAPTQEAVRASGWFGVNILEQAHGEIAKRFATPIEDKFADLPFRLGPHGQPLLDGALAAIECSVQESVVGGTHRVFLADVRHAEVRNGAPLAYFRGRFGSFELAADDAALRTVRRLVLLRELPLGATLEPADVAKRVGVPEPSVHYALTRLLAEGLVSRTAAGYVQAPLDVQASDDALDAKLVIDLAAVRCAVDAATDAQLDELLELAAATTPEPGRARDVAEVEREIAANDAFHERSVALGGNAALLRAYRQLSLPTVIAPVLARKDAETAQLAADHVAIAEGLRARDRARVERLLAEHHAHGKELHRRAILAAGGAL